MIRMSFSERESFIQKERIERDKIMSPKSKGGEYGCGYANENFRLAGDFMNQSAEEACITYLLKHLIALRNHAHGLGSSKKPPAPEGIRSKCHDIANYVEILACLFKEDEMYF